MANPSGNKWKGDAVVNGKRTRITFATLAEAEAFERDPYAALGVAKVKNTIGQLFPIWTREVYGKTRNSRNELRISEELVERFGADLPVDKLDRKRIKDVLADLEAKGNKKGTLNSKMAVLSKLLNYAIAEEVLTAIPAIPFFKPDEGRIRSLSREEEALIFSHLSEPYRMFAQFLLHTGCRDSEAKALQWSDVAPTTVTFWRTKTDKPRTIPLTKKAKEALDWAKQGKPIPNARTPANKLSRVSKLPFEAINYHTFLNEWHRAKEKAGLGEDKQVVPYVLRHTCATRLAQGGMSELRLMKWMGHSNLMMTRRYTHYTVDDLVAGIALLEA